jgi:hypothetical protein
VDDVENAGEKLPARLKWENLMTKQGCRGGGNRHISYNFTSPRDKHTEAIYTTA